MIQDPMFNPSSTPLTKAERELALATMRSGCWDADAEVFIDRYEALCASLEAERDTLRLENRLLNEQVEEMVPDARIDHIDAAFAALESVTSGEYSAEDRQIAEGLSSARAVFAEIATLQRKVDSRECHISQLIEEKQHLEAERDALRAELAQVRALQGWQPIATALKDGSQVELWGPDGIDVGEWHDHISDLIESGVLVEPGSDAGWYGACGYWPGGNQPTHWRPIVGPPSGEALATGTPPPALNIKDEEDDFEHCEGCGAIIGDDLCITSDDVKLCRACYDEIPVAPAPEEW